MSNEPIVAYHVFVRGRVQGVGFRYFVQECAETLGVSGYVRNLPDGRVEVFAQGREGLVDDLLSRIRKGPPGAHVEETVIEPTHPTALTEGFRIRHW
jgi:acylphosphatase